MQMKTIQLIVMAVLCAALSGCTETPKEMIVGKWKFDHMELNQPLNSDEMKNDMAIAMAESQFRSLSLEYFEDGTCVTSISGKEAVHSTYWLESNDTYLCGKKEDGGETDRTSILRISSDTLVLGDEKGGIVLVKVK